MQKPTILRLLVISLVFALIFSGACSGSSKIDSITIAQAYPDATREEIINAFLPYNFDFAEEKTYSGQPMITAVSPDGAASLQLLGPAEDLKAARVLIYLPIEASYEYADQQYTYFELLMNSVFQDNWPAMHEWLITATNSIAEHTTASLQGGATVTTPHFTDAGELAASLYVRLDGDSNGFVMGLVIGDWLKDISYNAQLGVWKP